MNLEEIIKTCKLCGSSENKFRQNRHQCIKCLSSINNKKLKENNFYKEYYKQNRDKMIDSAKQSYKQMKILQTLS